MKQSKNDERIAKLEERLEAAEAIIAILVERFPNPLPTEDRKRVTEFLESRKVGVEP